MGKVDVGGGKPLAPSPKHSVAAPAPKHVVAPRSWSFPKPSRGSVYQHAAPHRVVSHNAGYGPRPTGSGVHAAVRAQPVKSRGHSAATARLASKLAQQGTATAKASVLGDTTLLKMAVLRSLLAGGPWQSPSAKLENWELHQPDAWWTHTRAGVYGTAGDVSAGVAGVVRGGLGLPLRPPHLPDFGVGPQGGLQPRDSGGYDRLPPNQPLTPVVPQSFPDHNSHRFDPTLRHYQSARKPIPNRKYQRMQGLGQEGYNPNAGFLPGPRGARM